MDKREVLERIEQIGVIPAVRVAHAEDALFAARAVSTGGIPIVELTMTIPGALEVISTLAREIPGIIIGAGTIWNQETARRSMEAGAAFLTTTGLVLDIVEFAQSENVPVLPGALTPTEIAAAWMAGADLVKIFPCSQVGGAAYIKMMKPPFPEVRFVASGGVTQQTAGDFILAGATVLGIGSDLIPHEAIRARRPEWIHELARRFTKTVKEARQRIASSGGVNLHS